VSLDECLGVSSVEYDPAILSNDTGSACTNVLAPASTSDTNYCGATWEDASGCDHPCPNGFNSECPVGTFCFADIECNRAELPEDTNNYCGGTWFDASRCDYGKCPNGLDSECPDGTSCFGDIECSSAGLPEGTRTI